MGWGWGGAGRGGSKKFKPILAPPHGAGLKSCPIPAPLPLRSGENPHGVKRGGAGKNCHPYFRTDQNQSTVPFLKHIVVFCFICWVYTSQCYGYCSVLAEMARKFRSGKQTRTTSSSISQIRFRPVSVCFGRSGLFQLISAKIKDSVGMNLVQIKLNLNLQNRPKSVHCSFPQTHRSLLLHMLSRSRIIVVELEDYCGLCSHA